MFVLAIAIAVMTAITIIPTTTAPLSFTMALLSSMMRFRHSALRCWSIGWHTLPEEVVADIIREEVGDCCVPLWSRHDIILCATKVCYDNALLYLCLCNNINPSPILWWEESQCITCAPSPCSAVSKPSYLYHQWFPCTNIRMILGGVLSYPMPICCRSPVPGPGCHQKSIRSKVITRDSTSSTAP